VRSPNFRKFVFTHRALDGTFQIPHHGKDADGRNKEVAAMRTGPHPSEVRSLVIENFLEFGAATSALAELSENIVIDDGRYMARTYKADGLMAMWLIDIGLLQFYDDDGDMLRTVNLFQARTPQRMAA
jgi:hypothetical protein